jgi:phosphoglycerol transferase MdoB-like AlkP superfamily enzyme
VSNRPARPWPAAAAPRGGGGSWCRTAAQVQRDVALWLVCVATLSATRLFLIASFRSRLSPHVKFSQVVTALANGLRFDAQVATLWVVIPLLMSVACAFVDMARTAQRLRQAAAFAFLTLTSLIAAISWGFVREFDDQFNHFVLGAVYDDLGAILKTVVNAYPLLWPLAVAALAGTLVYVASRRVLTRALVSEDVLERLPPTAKASLSVLLVLGLVGGIRGSVGRRPLQQNDVAVTSDAFLNKLILNPYKALYYAIESQRELADPSGIHRVLPDGDVRAAVARLFPACGPTENLDACLQRTARGTATPPRHVFLIIMESYNGWPLLPPYRALGITHEMERLGRSGLLFERFLPAGIGTMDSLGPLLSGLGEPGIPINYQVTSRLPYPTGVATVFHRLGYRTRFFYAGYLSWQRTGDFAREQGFDEVFGGGDVGSWTQGNEWGVADEWLFDFVLGKVRDDGASFNMILTVSNHPPFDVDVASRGFPLREMPASLRGLWDREYTLRQIGHFWYADWCLGRFADAAEGTLPGILLAVTGDHYSRRFLNGRPGLVERALVPLLLHGPQVLASRAMPERAFGSQLDLTRTLVELAAPAGFVYHALGVDLLSPSDRVAAFGAGMAIGANFVAELGDTPSWAPMPGCATPAEPPDLLALKRTSDDLRAVSWWRVVRGPGLPATERR